MKKWSTSMHLELVTGHLNTSVGPVVMPSDVAVALRTGSLAAASEQARPILAFIFVECSSQAILGCLREAGASLHSVQLLYEETLAACLPPVVEWEDIFRNFS